MRIIDTLDYSANFAYVADFGFYANGTLSLTLDWNPDKHLYPIQLLIFNQETYSNWYTDKFITNNWHLCNPTTSLASFHSILTESPQTWNFTTTEPKSIHHIIIQHCNSTLSGFYSITAIFLNPNDQHLDWRDLYSLFILKIMISVFTLLLLFWIFYIFIKRRKLFPIHIYCGLITIFYIDFLIVHEISLNQAQYSDNVMTYFIFRIFFEVLYSVILFTTLLVASSGWGLLNITLTWSDIFKSIIIVICFVVPSFLELHWQLGNLLVVVLLIHIVGTLSLWQTLYANNESAKQFIKAHLLAIKNSGIAPASTPIYQKLFLYEVSLVVTAGVVFVFLTLNLFLVLLHAQNWVIGLTNNSVQLVTVIALMVLYRPRGKAVDDFLQPDVEGEGQERGEIAVEELEAFEIDEGGQGMMEWEEGMNLPLQPQVVRNLKLSD
jgi:hypothetical protein